MAAASAAAVLLFVPVAACSDDEAAPSSVLDQVAPTKADIEREAGVVFPASTEGFRLTRLGGTQIDVTFTIAAADVDAFASETGVTLTEGARTITHASPLWNVAVQGPISGGTSSKDGVRRDVEVVPAGDRATVRLTIRPTT